MIEFKNLVKKFGDRTILKGISLNIPAGEIVFVLGTSGTGKSVLLKTLVGLLQADEGEIWIAGEQVQNFTEEQFLPIRRKCGMVFQQPALFDSLSIYDNVAFGLRRHLRLQDHEIKDRVEKSLQLVNVSLSHLQQRPSQISYGTQKRVSLARTIALQPQILLFDEPTTGLDPVTTKAVNQLISDLSRSLKTTSIVVSHDMECALEIADRIVMLDQGHIVAIGTPDEMRTSKVPLVRDFLQEALQMQAQGGAL